MTFFIFKEKECTKEETPNFKVKALNPTAKSEYSEDINIFIWAAHKKPAVRDLEGKDTRSIKLAKYDKENGGESDKNLIINVYEGCKGLGDMLKAVREAAKSKKPGPKNGNSDIQKNSKAHWLGVGENAGYMWNTAGGVAILGGIQA